MVAALAGAGKRWTRDDDVALLAGIRRCDSHAVRDFVRRFHLVLLDQAHRLGVDSADREDVVVSFLGDIVMKLARMPAPDSLPAFVVRAFRNAVTDAHRSDEAHHRVIAQALITEGDSATVVTAACSEYTLRAMLGPDNDPATHVAATDLVTRLLSGCTRDERQLLVWTSRRVPMREIARWLGISYDAAKQRASRLRARLAREAVAVIPELQPQDRIAMTRLLERVGVIRTKTRDEGGAAA